MPSGVYTRTKKTRSNIGSVRRGTKLPTEWVKHMADGHRGLKRTEETKRRMSEAKKGKVFTAEHRRKLSEAKIGYVPWGKGKKMPESFVRSRVGAGNPAWQGGISFEPYSLDWTKTLKRSIRERDKYTCQIGGELQSDTAFPVHHIDYDKRNCDPENLITLCRKCHTKTNTNRDYWIEYFTNKKVLTMDTK